MNFEKYEEYFTFIGGSLFDAYVMKIIATRNPQLKWLYNDTNDTKVLKYTIAWKFDMNTTCLVCVDDFMNKLFECDDRVVAVNISLQEQGIPTGHRNLLFIDTKNGIFQLFEPNLVHENDEENEENDVKYIGQTIRKRFEERQSYFRELLQNRYHTTFKTMRLYNLGSWMYYNIRKTNNTSLIKEANCTLVCYMFLIWILQTKDRLCQGELLEILERECNVEYQLSLLFDNVSELVKPSQLINNPHNCGFVMFQIKNKIEFYKLSSNKQK